MEIVEYEQRRGPERGVDGQPVQAVENRERRIGGRRVGELTAEQRRRRRGGAGEQLAALLHRRRREHRLEQLPDEAERELPLELAAPGGEDPHPGAHSERARLGEEARFADPRARLDHQEAAVACGAIVNERPELRDVRVAFEQRGRERPAAPCKPRCARHGAILRGLGDARGADLGARLGSSPMRTVAIASDGGAMRRPQRTWTEETRVGGTPDQVLDLLTDPRAIADWAPIGFDVAELDGDRLYEGCAVKVSGVIAGRRLVFDVEITRASDRCLALRADGPIVIEAEYLLSPLRGGSDVRASVSIAGRGLLGGVIAQVAEALLAAGALRASLARIGRELRRRERDTRRTARPALAA